MELLINSHETDYKEGNNKSLDSLIETGILLSNDEEYSINDSSELAMFFQLDEFHPGERFEIIDDVVKFYKIKRRGLYKVIDLISNFLPLGAR